MKNNYMCLVFFVCFCFSVSSQQVVVTDDATYTTPASGAMLDVKSTSKGFMPPRVALTSLTDVATIASPAVGLMVFNTGTGGLTESGIYYWNGTIWSKSITGGTGTVDYVSVADNGTVTLHGTATTWNDLMVNPITAKNNGGSTPGFDIFVNTRVSTWTFSDNSTQELSFTVQMPHDYKEGSRIYPHVHWSTQSAAGAGRVKWVLEYQWVNHADFFSPSSTLSVSGSAIEGNSTRSLSAYEHIITSIPSTGVDGTGKKISSLLACRLYRDGTNSIEDTFAGTAYLLSIDFHYEIDSFGSRSQYSKDSE